jgi:hypothetical protein
LRWQTANRFRTPVGWANRSRAGSGARAPTTPTLGLTVLVVPDGFSLKARGGNVAPGCNDTGPGIAIPNKGSDYDYDGLKACAIKLKGAAAEFKDEMGVTISGNPAIPYQVIIGAMDAVRKNDQGEDLFPEVSFGIAR